MHAGDAAQEGAVEGLCCCSGLGSAWETQISQPEERRRVGIKQQGGSETGKGRGGRVGSSNKRSHAVNVKAKEQGACLIACRGLRGPPCLMSRSQGN